MSDEARGEAEPLSAEELTKVQRQFIEAASTALVPRLLATLEAAEAKLALVEEELRLTEKSYAHYVEGAKGGGGQDGS